MAMMTRVCGSHCKIIAKQSIRIVHSKVPGPDKVSRQSYLWSALFGKYLLATNTISAGVLMVVGDIASQEIEYRRKLISKRYDWKRVAKMFIVGSLQGPPHHYFYKYLDRVMPGATFKTAIKKILLDQIIMSPIFILIFFYPACFIERKTLKESNDEVKSKFLTVYMVDWSVWPAAQFINFYYLQPKYRVLYVNMITMLFDVFLSFMKHKPE